MFQEKKEIQWKERKTQTAKMVHICIASDEHDV